jgi:hypothetical protein
MAQITGGLSTFASFTAKATTGYQTGTAIPISPARLFSTFTAGLAADQLDNLAPILLTFVASTPQTIDLTALSDVLGLAITAARVRFILIRNLSTTDGFNLLVGGAGTNEWNGPLSSGGKLTVGPSSAGNDGAVLLSAPNTTGYPVSSTSKLLKLDPGANAFQAIVLIGTSSV